MIALVTGGSNVRGCTPDTPARISKLPGFAVKLLSWGSSPNGPGHQSVIGLALLAACACNGGPRDATEHTTDVRVDGGSGDSYAYVARRSRVAVGLAEVRGASANEAKDLVDRLAGSASACFEGLAKEGKLVDGAMRLVLTFDGGGVGAAPEVVLAPGPGVAANGLLCVVAPARMIALAPNDGGARAIALEIAWGASIAGGG